VSTCISRHGEFSDHVPAGAPELRAIVDCERCGHRYNIEADEAIVAPIGDDVTEILGRLYRKIDALEAELANTKANYDALKKARDDEPKTAPTHLAPPMVVSARRESVGFKGAGGWPVRTDPIL